MIWLALNGDEWVHIPSKAPRRVIASAGEFARLELWNFTRQKHNDDTHKRCSGIWRITDKGSKFAWGRLKVPSHVKLYAGRLLGFDGDLIDIRGVLGTRFDYGKLMNREYW